MFQFRRFPSYDYFIHRMMTEYCSAGFPHSDIHGSMDAFSSPWLFADRCVLRRLLVPRHSPCALCSLTIVSNLLVLSTRRKLLVFTLKFTMFVSHYYSISLLCSVFKVRFYLRFTSRLSFLFLLVLNKLRFNL